MSGRTLVQIPDKSTFPSLLRGAGAARFGLPSAVLGTSGVGYVSHCADARGSIKATPSAPARRTTLNLANVCMCTPHLVNWQRDSSRRLPRFLVASAGNYLSP